MNDVISALFGTYEPIVVTLSDLSEKVAIDYGYFAGIFLFGLCFYCTFRLIGGFFK